MTVGWWLAWSVAAAGPCEEAAWPARCRRALREVGRVAPEAREDWASALGRGVDPPKPSGGEEADVVVATWNLGLVYIVGEYRVPFAASRREAVPAALVALVEEGGAEIVLLQEGYREEDRALIASTAATLGWTHVDADALGPARSGLHLLVAPRFEVRASGSEPLPRDSFALAGWPRRLLWADLVDGDRSLRVGNVHLTPLPRRRLSWHRTEQIIALQAALGGGGALASPCRILGGDFNASPAWAFPSGAGPERVLAWDRAAWSALVAGADGAAVSPEAPLWTLAHANPVHTDDPLGGEEPDRQVDHLVGYGLTATWARTALTGPVPGAPAASDHFALLAGFTWAEAAR